MVSTYWTINQKSAWSLYNLLQLGDSESEVGGRGIAGLGWLTSMLLLGNGGEMLIPEDAAGRDYAYIWQQY